MHEIQPLYKNTGVKYPRTSLLLRAGLSAKAHAPRTRLIRRCLVVLPPFGLTQRLSAFAVYPLKEEPAQLPAFRRQFDFCECRLVFAEYGWFSNQCYSYCTRNSALALIPRFRSYTGGVPARIVKLSTPNL